MLFARRKSEMPTAETALKGRAEPIPTAATHYLNKHPLRARIRRAPRRPFSASAASGALSASSGRWATAST